MSVLILIGVVIRECSPSFIIPREKLKHGLSQNIKLIKEVIFEIEGNNYTKKNPIAKNPPVREWKYLIAIRPFSSFSKKNAMKYVWMSKPNIVKTLMLTNGISSSLFQIITKIQQTTGSANFKQSFMNIVVQ